MGTRSRIGMLLPNGKVKSIYCHWDGYPEHNGRILQECWQESVVPLIALGDLSTLGEVLGSDEGTGVFDARRDLASEDPKSKWCVAYGRDRGERGCKARTHSIDDWPDSGQEWEYLWTGKAWQAREPNGRPWEPLTALLQRVRA